MQRAQHPARKLSRRHGPLVRHILAITSERLGLTRAQRDELSHLVLAKLLDPRHPPLESLAGGSKLQTYLTVLVQQSYQELNGPATTFHQGSFALEHAIEQTSSSIPAHEALILKMWFESGMTTQKIASVLGLRPSDVHAVVSSRTSRVQEWLAQENPPPSPSGD